MLHYTQQELEEEAGKFGLDMLEQFFVPLNPATDIANCEATVQLKPTGDGLWTPSLPEDALWDETNKQLAEVLH